MNTRFYSCIILGEAQENIKRQEAKKWLKKVLTYTQLPYKVEDFECRKEYIDNLYGFYLKNTALKKDKT